MELLRRHLQRWTWVALVAVLGLALAPTVSQAVVSAAAHPWDEVCSGLQGPSPSPAGGESAGHGHADHCALCVQLGAGPLPVVVAVAALPRIERLGTAETAAPLAPLSWHAAQPRGPPAFA